MVKMRLVRMGDKKNPIYRVVVVDSRKAATGEYIECVGHYRPTCDPIELTIDVEKAKNWLSKGVQPTETVLLRRAQWKRAQNLALQKPNPRRTKNKQRT